jgi:hypothetical protein
VRDRDAFLFDLATALAGIVDPGDGDVARAIRAVQRKKGKTQGPAIIGNQHASQEQR